VYQINAVKAAVIFTHPDSLQVALASAHAAGIATDHVVLFDVEGADTEQSVTVKALISQGLTSVPNFIERKLAPGEGKTKVAFLNFSSGTTGRPKASTHFTKVTNVAFTWYSRPLKYPTTHRLQISFNLRRTTESERISRNRGLDQVTYVVVVRALLFIQKLGLMKYVVLPLYREPLPNLGTL
jgi:acyl-CoA synthetase (AMP-forming)/AMP-acid ligase II